MTFDICRYQQTEQKANDFMMAAYIKRRFSVNSAPEI